MIDLAVVSVLLDAGAGPDWRYVEAGHGQRSPDPRGWAWRACTPSAPGCSPATRREPLQVDAAGLRRLTADRLAEAFQVARAIRWWAWTAAWRCCAGSAMRWPRGPGVGAVAGQAACFDRHGDRSAGRRRHDILSQLVGVAVGYLVGGQHYWRSAARRLLAPPRRSGPGLTRGWMPFHKLSQWLTYSLLEPFEWAGVTVTGLDALTGLPEYRNGGLLLDTGVLRLRDPALGGAHLGSGRRIGGRVARPDRGPARRTGAAGARSDWA